MTAIGKVYAAMTLVLFMHPLASFCHKVQLALYENATPCEERVVDLGDPASSAELREHWPVGKIPVLRDERRGRSVAETSIIIEYLSQHYPGPLALIPPEPEQALQARLWDRFFDLYVQAPMQKIVGDRLRAEDQRDGFGVDEARAVLGTAYDMLERRLAPGRWAAGEAFTIADCAAAPALFYAHTLVPFGAARPRLRDYFERLCARPSFVRVLDRARPYFQLYPYYDQIPARFLAGGA